MAAIDPKLLLGHRLMVHFEEHWHPVKVLNTIPYSAEGNTEQPLASKITHLVCSMPSGADLQIQVKALTDCTKVRPHDLWADEDMWLDFERDCYIQRAKELALIRQRDVTESTVVPCTDATLKRALPVPAALRLAKVLKRLTDSGSSASAG